MTTCVYFFPVTGSAVPLRVFLCKTRRCFKDKKHQNKKQETRDRRTQRRTKETVPSPLCTTKCCELSTRRSTTATAKEAVSQKLARSALKYASLTASLRLLKKFIVFTHPQGRCRLPAHRCSFAFDADCLVAACSVYNWRAAQLRCVHFFTTRGALSYLTVSQGLCERQASNQAGE